MCIALYCVSMQQPSFKELDKRDGSTQAVENTVEATRQDGTTEVVCWDWVHHVTVGGKEYKRWTCLSEQLYVYLNLPYYCLPAFQEEM